LIHDRLRGYTPRPPILAQRAIEERHKSRRAEELAELRAMEPLLGPVAAGDIPLDEADAKRIALAMERAWQRAMR
jgi:hypothetical protein